MDLTFENRYGTELCRTATHIYLLPHPDLRAYIAHYTYCPPVLPRPAPAPGSRLLTLLPDASGCLVFTFAPDGLDSRVYGPTTRTVDVEKGLDGSPARFFVEFRPGGLFAFTGLPQWELTDRIEALTDVSPALAALAAEALGRAAGLDEFAYLIDRALLRLDRSPAPVSPLLRPGRGARENEVSGYSSRHLSRLFREGAGMGYKSYLRVLRINAAARRLRAGPESLTLTALAQDLGYFDQAHFIHDFKATCGVTPGTYRTRLTDFYNEPLKF